MTKSAAPVVPAGSALVREPRPFQFLTPARLPLRRDAVDPAGVAELDAAMGACLAMLTRSLVDFTIAQQNRRARERGNPQAPQLSVLNRRRRAARAWLVAIAAGRVDAGTLHALGAQWIPTLTGTGPDLRRAARPGRALIEFVRGAITACIFDEARECLLPEAKALHALEGVLAAHLAAIQQAARAAFAK